MLEQSTEKQPSAFKQEWEAKKLLKKSKKKARQSLQKRGHSHGEASSMVKQAIKNINQNNNAQPQRKAAARGG